MKNVLSSFPVRAAVLIMLFNGILALSTQCKKEELPHPVFGQWETVNAVGFKWEYEIEESCNFCRSLPEYFGTTKFCYPYSRSADTLFILTPDPERWTLQVQTRDAILVTVNRESGTSDAFLLSRKK